MKITKLNEASKKLITPDPNTIYVDSKTNKTYKWDGSRFVEVEFQGKPNNSNGSGNGPKLPVKPTIGSKGDKDIQDKEQAEREANNENPESDEERDARIKNAQDALRNPDNQNQIQQDIDKKKGEEEVAKAERDLRRYNDNPLTKFKLSLAGFIKKEIAPGRDKSWSRINKKYAGTGLIRPGTSRNMEKHIPAINVYFDHSGSWDESKIKVGRQAVATLKNYVKNGDLKINLYYFANDVHGDPESALREGGTEGQPILNHIAATKPDNVIIMTDSDIDDCRTDISVPGAVWFLFKGGRSQNLVDHLQGKRMTREFEI